METITRYVGLCLTSLLVLGILLPTTHVVPPIAANITEAIPEKAWPVLMAALTMIFACLAAALAISKAAVAGSAAMTENPELSIWTLLFVALGEGIAIYGLIVAILILTA